MSVSTYDFAKIYRMKWRKVWSVGEGTCAQGSPRSANAIESALTSVDYISDISFHFAGQPGHWVCQRLGALQDAVGVTRFTGGTRVRLLLSCHIHGCGRDDKTKNVLSEAKQSRLWERWQHEECLNRYGSKTYRRVQPHWYLERIVKPNKVKTILVKGVKVEKRNSNKRWVPFNSTHPRHAFCCEASIIFPFDRKDKFDKKMESFAWGLMLAVRSVGMNVSAWTTAKLLN